MNTDKPHKNSSGFITPPAYFDTFEDRLLKKMSVQDELVKNKNTGFTVPDHYFATLEQRVSNKIAAPSPPKVKPLWTSGRLRWTLGLAASILIALAIFTQNQGVPSINQITTVSIEEYLSEENLTPYDIASFLNPEDIRVEDFVTTTLSDETLENYLLNQISLEDLLTEK